MLWVTLGAAGLAVVGLAVGLVWPAATRCGGGDGSLLDCLRTELDARVKPVATEIGRASCRERV